MCHVHRKAAVAEFPQCVQRLCTRSVQTDFRRSTPTMPGSNMQIVEVDFQSFPDFPVTDGRTSMEGQHGSSCGRRIAEQIERVNGTKSHAALEIHRHCGVSLLRAHRIAYGYTL